MYIVLQSAVCSLHRGREVDLGVVFAVVMAKE
jgi:hypothetical protein